MKILPLSLWIGIAMVVSSDLSLAGTFNCDFDQWSGGQSEEQVISWVGLGFVGDSEASTLRLKVDGGFTDPVAAKVTKRDRFTEFSLTQNNKNTRGETLTMRYIFRAFNNGKCEGRATLAGISDSLMASGRVSGE